MQFSRLLVKTHIHTGLGRGVVPFKDEVLALDTEERSGELTRE